MPKAKVSLTLDTAVLAAVDEEVGGRLGDSRSAVIQRVLDRWLRLRRKQALDDAVERYYVARSRAEAAEDHAWAELAAGSLAEYRDDG
jgi:metal-responsive CopG/Arc/MetJ family transcriptional regulator